MKVKSTLFEELSKDQDDSVERSSFYMVDKTFCKERLTPYLTDMPESTNQDKLTKKTVSLPVSLPVPILPIFVRKPSRSNEFVLMQNWEGVVLKVRNDSFLARLVDLTSKGVEEEAELLMDEVSDEDRELIKPGAIFYWFIGYLDSRTGQRTRSSIIRFRRLPAWQEKEIQRAQREAEQIQESLGWREEASSLLKTG